MNVIILQSMGFFMWKLLEGFYDEEKKCIVLCVLFESKYYIVEILRICCLIFWNSGKLVKAFCNLFLVFLRNLFTIDEGLA